MPTTVGYKVVLHPTMPSLKKVRSKARAAVCCAKTRWLECLAAQAEASWTAHDGKKCGIPLSLSSAVIKV